MKRIRQDQGTKILYIDWKDNDMDSSNDFDDNEEVNLCLMTNHENIDEEVSSFEFELSPSYDDLLDAL